MNVVVSGGTGLIGQALSERLAGMRHTVVVLTRNPLSGSDGFAQWDGSSPGPWMKRIEGADAIVNLAGESIAGSRWTRSQKSRILESRLRATRALNEAIAAAKSKPGILISASAVGYYGNVEEGDVTESFPQGAGFLSEVCARWESESRRAETHGVRVVNPRFGVVLARNGGALPRFLLPFRLYAGGPIGSGRQWFPWVHIADVVESILFALHNARLSGPLNIAAPQPATMKEFCAALGMTLGRPSWAPVPAFVLRAALGELSGMILDGQKVVPRKLLDEGFQFRHPRLQEALSSVLRA